MRSHFSLEGKLALLVGVAVLAAVLVTALIGAHVANPWLAVLFAVAVVLPAAIWLLGRFMHPVNQLFSALRDGVAGLRDGDFSVNIARTRNDELGELVTAYNGVGDILRDERQSLMQRELLLDTVIQSSPVALLLVNAAGNVIYSNTAARELIGDGRKIEGYRLATLLAHTPPALAQALQSTTEGLVTVEQAEAETFHVSQREFHLHTQPHRLYLVKRLTRELNRQEVQTWKKVIRVISHELNNSLAPIASLAHSGTQLVARRELDRLEGVFGTIGERARHLKRFIDGYARFAKLPQPRPAAVAWRELVDNLQCAVDFEVEGDVPDGDGYFDLAQLEQVMINLLKNARESGSAAGDVCLRIGVQDGVARLMVLDRGGGMPEEVLQQALLPFYSTKRTGTGLGLPLAREIAEAHGGRLHIRNRAGGGLAVEVVLPQPGKVNPVGAASRRDSHCA